MQGSNLHHPQSPYLAMQCLVLLRIGYLMPAIDTTLSTTRPYHHRPAPLQSSRRPPGSIFAIIEHILSAIMVLISEMLVSGRHSRVRR